MGPGLVDYEQIKAKEFDNDYISSPTSTYRRSLSAETKSDPRNSPALLPWPPSARAAASSDKGLPRLLK